MRSLTFEGDTWEKYETLSKNDKILHKNLCKILKQLQRDDPTQGYGKPEALKHSLSGLYSRRLSQKDRLVYSFTDISIHIFAIGGHY
ncbi:MAG: Txe/YoeB family addiction module toxin [Sulfurovum sp.]|nr:Txe/YoeB family addiction module toxin [Sulfurovum sp.]